jgi:hypothetical protein
MKLISDVGLDAGYGSVTAPHMAASASALTELARLTSADPGQRGARPLHVRLSHFEHGAALSLQLFGFAVLPATGEPVIRPTPPGMAAKPPAAGLRSPEAVSAEDPLIYAVVANHSVAVQIEHTLAMLAMLVARQEFISGGGLDIPEIDRLAAEVDTRATTAVRDTLRSQGWRAAAQAISARSAAAGLPLAVTYSPVLMDASALALRAPILRHVYNEMPVVRKAIDKVATMLSQGLMAVGSSSGSERVAAFARDLLDVGSTRTYLAHLARDAFVCGNGYLSFGTVSDEDIRLLQPEQVTILDSETVRVADGGTDVIHRPVMHVTGADQQGSPYGVSVLEPFVHLQNEREIFQESIEMAEAWNQIPAPEDARSWALRNVPLARRRLKDIDDRIAATLGGPTHLEVEPPADLYFPGLELMTPAAAGLSLVTRESAGNAAAGEQN